MPPRLDKTILDYVVIAIIPALIMCLVGSLVFFLLTVFYHGQYEARLFFIFAMFVLAAVLIARISMEEGAEYAMLFALPLALAAGLALMRFVEIQGPLKVVSPLVNLTLLGLVWWSAHKLTWDCTLIDEHEDATGEGLLQTIGLDDRWPTAGGQPDAHQPAADTPPEITTSQPRLHRLWRRFVESQRRPHAPGVWVVYFSLAALPIFGVGQRFLPSADVASRQYVFRLLFVYVASGLGLMLTTSFLGLRRYLRQRRVEMSSDMARTWLVSGSVMIGLLMAFCTLLPRPSAEYPLSRLPFQFGAPDGRRPSRLAVGDDGPRDDRPGRKTSAEYQRGPAESDTETQMPDDSQPVRSGEEKSDGQKADGGDADDADPRSKQPDAGKDRSQQDDRGQPSSSGPRSPPEMSAREEPQPSTKNRPRHDPAGSDEPSEEKNSSQPWVDRHESSPNNEGNQTDADSSDRAKEGSSPGSRPLTRDQPPSTVNPGQVLNIFGSTIGGMFKLVFYVAVVAVVGYLLWQYRDRIKLAWLRFLDEMRQLWGRLFGRVPGTSEAADDEPVQPAARPRPFADFADPFATGLATRYSAPELIKYSFEALEAWARERGYPRQLDQTPTEFALQVGRHRNDLGTDARNLALLYSRAAYAQGSLPASTSQQLKQLWSQLRIRPTDG